MDSERSKLKQLIEKYGGMISTWHECYTYQIELITDPLTPKHYFHGDVYQSKWLIDSVKEGVLLNKEDYLAYTNTNEGCKRLTFGKKHHPKYTITEAIKVFRIALTQEGRQRSKSAQFWLEIERQEIIPRRTADSLRNFWKTVERIGLEKYMRQQLDSNTWYCHAFSKIPKVQLICTIVESQQSTCIEQDLIDLAERAPTISTHRQFVLKGKKAAQLYGDSSMVSKAVKK